MEAQQPFARAVNGELLGDDFRPAQSEMLGKLAAKRLGDVGHDVEVGRPAHIDPAPELGHPHAMLPLGHAKRG